MAAPRGRVRRAGGRRRDPRRRRTRTGRRLETHEGFHGEARQEPTTSEISISSGMMVAPLATAAARGGMIQRLSRTHLVAHLV